MTDTDSKTALSYNNNRFTGDACHSASARAQYDPSIPNSIPEEAEDTTISSASSSFSIIYGILSEIDKQCDYIKLKTNTTETTYYIQQSLFNPKSSLNKTHQFLKIIPLSLLTEYVAVFLDSSQKVIGVQRFQPNKNTLPNNYIFPDKPADPDFVLFPTTLQPLITTQSFNNKKYNYSYTGSTILDKELYEYIQNHCDTFGTINPPSPEYPLMLQEQSQTLDDVLEHYILITQLKRYDDGTIKIHYVFLGKRNPNIDLSNYGFKYTELPKDPHRTYTKPMKYYLKSDKAFNYYQARLNNEIKSYGFQKRFSYKFNNQNQTTHADIVIQPISGDYSIKNILDYIRNPENIAEYTSPFKLSSVHEICSTGKTYYNHFKYESQAFIFPINLPENTLKSLKKPLFLDQNLTQLLDIYTKNRLIFKYRIYINNTIAGINRVLSILKGSFIKKNQALQDKFNQFLPDSSQCIKSYSNLESCSLLHSFNSTYKLTKLSDSSNSSCTSRFSARESDEVHALSKSILPFEFIHLFSLYIHDQNQLNQLLSKIKNPFIYNFSDNYIPSTQTILQLFRKSNFKTKSKSIDKAKLKENPYEVYKQLNNSCNYIPIHHSFNFIKDTIPYREPLPEDKLHIYFTAKQNNISYDSAELYFDGFIFDEPIPGLYELTQQYRSEFLKFAQDKSNSQNQINNYFDHLTSKIKKYISDYEAQNPVEASRSLQNQFLTQTNIFTHIQPENGLEHVLEPLNAKSSNSLQTDFLSFSTRLTLFSQIYKNSSYSSFSLISHKTNQICIKIHQNIQNYIIPYIDTS